MNMITALERDVELIEVGTLSNKISLIPRWHLPKKNRPRCCVKSHTAQDTFRPIPGLISCAGVTGRWGLLSRAQNMVRCISKEDCDVCGGPHLLVIPV